jgi:cellulose synthase/poly-beta-1,6-N-acetylglucosamine synthase-like glycosyltransferase
VPVIVLAAVIALGAVGGAVLVAARRRRAPALPAAELSPAPVTVLVPMRDEQENVEECLAAILAQTTPVRVRVLDDGSVDSTGDLARRIAAIDSRVEVTTVPAPAAAVNGKVHALAHGAAGLETEWLLALDADARPAPDAVARALAAAEGRGLDAVSLAARQRARGLGEALITPPVFGLLDTMLGDWRRAATGEGEPVANGQFVLLRRAALEAAGGYESILGEPLDDVALARRLVACGFRVGFWRAGDVLEVRMYRGSAASFRGWRRNLALILGRRRGLVAATIAIATLPAAVALAMFEAGAPLAAAIAWSGGALASMRLRDETGSAPWWGLLYPLDALALAAVLVAATLDRGLGRLEPWRGRPLAGPTPD